MSNARGGQPLVYGLYIGTMLVAAIAMWLERLAIRRHRLVDKRDMSDYESRTGVLFIALLVVALALSMTVPILGLWPLLLLAIQGQLQHFFPALRD